MYNDILSFLKIVNIEIVIPPLGLLHEVGEYHLEDPSESKRLWLAEHVM